MWIGGTGQDLRSKARTLSKMPTKPEDLPHWNYDGSSTGQAPGTDSEVLLIPRAIFRFVLLRCCVYVFCVRGIQPAASWAAQQLASQRKKATTSRHTHNHTIDNNQPLQSL